MSVLSHAARLAPLRLVSAIAGISLGCSAEPTPPTVAPTSLTALAATPSYGPFTASTYPNPPPSTYSGPLFSVAHGWPTSPVAPPANPPWIAALRGQPISGDTALAYVDALKRYITPAMKTLIFNYAEWNGDSAGYYSSPWLAPYAEPIHGTYVGSGFPASMFPKSGLKVDMTTYVLTLYDKVSAYTLNKMWGMEAMQFNATATSGQFPEGSIVVKAALTTACASDWAPMAGAQTWPIYAPLDPSNGSGQQNTACPNNGSAGRGTSDPVLTNVYLFQFDIIVKDSKTAPKTGWVFSTLVYDASAEGADAWDKMIPLGAMWGNDPTVNSTSDPNAPLAESWINPRAPVYSTETLGWGGRLSGPNDGAVVAPAIVDGNQVSQVAASSCMSCHLAAEHPMKSFLLPSPPGGSGSPPPPTMQGDAIVLYTPGGQQWDTWFQDLYGNVPKDQGSIAFDYDMNTVFKAVPAWQAGIAEDQPAALEELRRRTRLTGRYNGTPIER